MNLLPKGFEQFREKEYWDKFFISRRQSPFEWYGDYAQLKSCLGRCIVTTDRLLVVGCGNSRLSADLYDVGFRGITNVDISNVVVKQMKRLHSRKRPAMKWLRSDITRRMTFADDEAFDVVVDKGTLDAIMTSCDEVVIQQINGMFSEVERVLTVGGKYVCISLLQEHILTRILDWFLDRHWRVLVYRNLLDEPETKSSTDVGIQFPVFVVVCTKCDAKHEQSVLECSLYDASVQRTDRDALQKSVRVLQQYAFLQHDLRRGVVAKDDEISLDLCVGADEHPKYHLFVVDRSVKQMDNRFAVFVVPQGRETEWLFASRQGRKQLADCATFERLVVTHLSRNHNFTDLDAVKAELSTKVMELSPKNLSKRTVVPFLSIGEGLGQRNLRHKATSESSGDFVVEDVDGEEGNVFRRLIFLNNPYVVQSEARLIRANAETDRDQWTVDSSYLACQHHESMVAALAFVDFGDSSKELSFDVEFRILVIGLGGGGLPTFLRHTFTKTKVDVVELDQSVYELAKNWFDFVVDDRLTVEIADGLTHVKRSPANAYDVVMIDADSKDATVGMSCPPQSFVQEEALIALKRMLTERGVLVLNLVCRNLELRDSVVERVKTVFTKCRSRKVPDELNEIIYATISSSSSSALRDRLERLHAHLTPTDSKTVDEMMEMLHLL